MAQRTASQTHTDPTTGAELGSGQAAAGQGAVGAVKEAASSLVGGIKEGLSGKSG
jgi:hypothetical protein